MNINYSERLVVSTACVLLHRFFLFQSMKKHNRFVRNLFFNDEKMIEHFVLRINWNIRSFLLHVYSLLQKSKNHTDRSRTLLLPIKRYEVVLQILMRNRWVFILSHGFMPLYETCMWTFIRNVTVWWKSFFSRRGLCCTPYVLICKSSILTFFAFKRLKLWKVLLHSYLYFFK